MKISLDGGALCAPPEAQYGTYRFSTELVNALKLYSQYDYNIYTFCTIPVDPELRTNIFYKKLIPATAWMKARIPLEEKFQPSDIFLGLNQALPAFSKSKLIAFSHGLSFLKFPELYKKDFPRLKTQLDDYIKRADWIIVTSRTVKKEMLEYAPDSKDKIKILPFGLPQEYENTAVLKLQKDPYFLYVGSDQPIKNLEALFRVFEQLRKEEEYRHFTLKLIGTDFERLPKGVSQIKHASLGKLQRLYGGASAYLTTSLYESFNYPVVEALSLGCPVIGLKSAIIYEQRAFTHYAADEQEMLDFMHYAARGSLPHIDRKALLQRFSWKNYVQTLEKLYT